MQALYLVLKTLHVYAFIAVIGVTLASVLAYRQFWKLYDKDRKAGVSAFAIVQGLQGGGMIGMVVLLLAGLGMLAIADWSFVDLTWFQIKLGLIVLIFVNGLTSGRASAMKLKSLIESGASFPDDDTVAAIKKRANFFMSTQLGLFAIIVLLSVFRFQ